MSVTDEQLVKNIRAAFDNFLSTVTTAEAAGIQTTIYTDFHSPELGQFNQSINLSLAERSCLKLRITKIYGDLS